MTNLDALMAEVEPYTVSPIAYTKRLTDKGITPSAEYTPDNKKNIALCAIAILVSLLPLASDNTGRASQSYSREGLKDRIKAICDENGLDSKEFVPSVTCYRNLF